MKKRVQLIALVLSLVLLLGTAAFAAGSYTKEITASYVGISLVVDGVPVTPKDATGKVVEPFIYEGTTYLPVRAVGEALGKPVSWDGATKTVYVGKVPGEETYLLDVCPPYQTNNCGISKANYYEIMGKKYAHQLDLNVGWDGFALFNTNGEYASLEFDIGHIDGTDTAGTELKIYLDGKYYDSINLTGDMLLTHVSIPLNYALQLKLEWVGTHWYEQHYGIVNSVLH